jgi:predicted amidophosphoribosyltransferase
MGKYRTLLAAYKFKKNPAVAHYFAEKIRSTLENGFFPQGGAPDGPCVTPGTGIVPVPPRPGKIRQTGWDQVEYLAKLQEKGGRNQAGMPVTRCLKRLPSKSQKELGRANRQTNLRGRIVPVSKVPEICILIDDVMTTGSTLDACAAALKEGGAQTIYGLCLFYD